MPIFKRIVAKTPRHREAIFYRRTDGQQKIYVSIAFGFDGSIPIVTEQFSYTIGGKVILDGLSFSFYNKFYCKAEAK